MINKIRALFDQFGFIPGCRNVCNLLPRYVHIVDEVTDRLSQNFDVKSIFNEGDHLRKRCCGFLVKLKQQFRLHIVGEFAWSSFLDLDVVGIFGFDSLNLTPRDIEGFHGFGYLHPLHHNVLPDERTNLRLDNGVWLTFLMGEPIAFVGLLLIKILLGLVDSFFLRGLFLQVLELLK
jgi:hypothetical protein